jgi:hypothetical protein
MPAQLGSLERDSYEHETRTAETADVQPPRHPSSHAKDRLSLATNTMI